MSWVYKWEGGGGQDREDIVYAITGEGYKRETEQEGTVDEKAKMKEKCKKIGENMNQ
jgi:hypothetical protein